MTGKEFLEELAAQSKLPHRFDSQDEFLAGLLEKYHEAQSTQIIDVLLDTKIIIDDVDGNLVEVHQDFRDKLDRALQTIYT